MMTGYRVQWVDGDEVLEGVVVYVSIDHDTFELDVVLDDGSFKAVKPYERKYQLRVVGELAGRDYGRPVAVTEPVREESPDA